MQARVLVRLRLSGCDLALLRREDLADQLMETRVLVRVRLSGCDLALLRREDLAELGQLRLRDALGGEGRDRGLDEAAELDDVGERMAARDEAHERSREIV